MANINLDSTDRVLIAGKTGSGKTYLAEHLLKRIKRVVVLDSKGTLAPWGFAEYGRAERNKLTRGQPCQIRVTADPLKDTADIWDEVLTACYYAGGVTVYIDELYAIVEPGTRAMPILNALWTRGRELGVGAWASTQRPVWIPLFVISEAEHYFCFRLTLDEDRKRMSAFMGEEVLTPISDEHGFFYARAIDTAPDYITRLESGTTQVNQPPGEKSPP